MHHMNVRSECMVTNQDARTVWYHSWYLWWISYFLCELVFCFSVKGSETLLRLRASETRVNKTAGTPRAKAENIYFIGLHGDQRSDIYPDARLTENVAPGLMSVTTESDAEEFVHKFIAEKSTFNMMC